LIDTSFDLSSDSGGQDPDLHSTTLRTWHKKLWSKDLPSGIFFDLTDTYPNKYLSFITPEFRLDLSSDSITNSYQNSKSKAISSILIGVDPELVHSFWKLNSTIGAFIIFPAKRINGLMNINGARGFSRKIADRFDLTLECIRLHYLELESPLSKILGRYSDFFQLFESFENYVRFFLLDDLTDSSCSRVKFFTEIAGPFEGSPLPKSVNEYLEYREKSMAFTQARNSRIGKWARENDL
jgi:hypothetical protein